MADNVYEPMSAGMWESQAAIWRDTAERAEKTRDAALVQVDELKRKMTDPEYVDAALVNVAADRDAWRERAERAEMRLRFLERRALLSVRVLEGSLVIA